MMSDERPGKIFIRLSRCTDHNMPSPVDWAQVAGWAAALDRCRLMAKVSIGSCSCMPRNTHMWRKQPVRDFLGSGVISTTYAKVGNI